MMALKLSELILHVGDEHIQIQNVLACATEVNLRKGVTYITFGTEAISAVDVMGRKETKIGLVIWLPKDRMPALPKLHAPPQATP